MTKMTEAYSDTGTVLSENECALVSVDNMSGLSLLIPQGTEHDDKEASPVMIYLTACAVRYDSDPDFVQEMIDWFVDLDTAA